MVFSIQLTPALYAQSADDPWSGPHAVFVMTNSVERNEVISYSRAKDGSLVAESHTPTGGRGSGGATDPLGSQGSLTLSQDDSLLFAVNAGSGNLSMFRVNGPKLTLAQVIATGGSAPVAVAQHDELVYVLNFAGNSNVVGLRLDEAGSLSEIPDSIRYLSAANSGPSSIAFSRDGHFLFVTEKITNNIDVFTVRGNGTLTQAAITKSPIPGLFDVVVAESGAILTVQTGPAGATNASSISSYQLEAGSALASITASVPTLGAATCWVALTPNGKFAFTSNAGSGTLSAFSISAAGVLTAVDGTVVASLPSGSTNLDIAVSSDSKYAYTLNNGTGTVGVFAVQPDGKLTLTSLTPGLRIGDGYNGIAAY